MDAAFISAISALAGSVIGGLTTGFTTLLSQRSQARAGMIAHALARREDLSRFRLANQRIGFLRFAACADSQGVWHGGKVSGYGER